MRRINVICGAVLTLATLGVQAAQAFPAPPPVGFDTGGENFVTGSLNGAPFGLIHYPITTQGVMTVKLTVKNDTLTTAFGVVADFGLTEIHYTGNAHDANNSHHVDVESALSNGPNPVQPILGQLWLVKLGVKTLLTGHDLDLFQGKLALGDIAPGQEVDVLQNYKIGNGITPPSPSAVNAPEPGSLALVLLGGGTLLRIQRRKKQ